MPREPQSDTRLRTCIRSSSKSSSSILRDIQRASCNCMFPSGYTLSLVQSRRTTGTMNSTGTTERRAHSVQRDTYDHWSFRESFARWKLAAASLPGARGVTSITSRSNWQARIHFHALLGHARQAKTPNNQIPCRQQTHVASSTSMRLLGPPPRRVVVTAHPLGTDRHYRDAGLFPLNRVTLGKSVAQNLKTTWPP